jgi:hypothetical protein
MSVPVDIWWAKRHLTDDTSSPRAQSSRFGVDYVTEQPQSELGPEAFR